MAVFSTVSRFKEKVLTSSKISKRVMIDLQHINKRRGVEADQQRPTIPKPFVESGRYNIAPGVE